MKHFFNRRENIVTEALDGLLLTSGKGRLARLDTYPDIKVVMRADWDKSKVAVISGGGAGHEPSHAGFVGRGMLTAAVSGEIFASPSVEAVLAAIRAVTGPKGALLVVKNYTGDRLNFGLAAEKARTEGFDVEMVIVADDIAIPAINQPRGVAGTLFVHKIAGYHAEAGDDLKTVASRAAAAASDIVSLGMSLSTCSVPGQAHEDRLGAEEGELGLGIHGEPGAERIALQPVANMVATMAERLEQKLMTRRELCAADQQSRGSPAPGDGSDCERRPFLLHFEGRQVDHRARADDDRAQHERLFAVTAEARPFARGSPCGDGRSACLGPRGRAPRNLGGRRARCCKSHRQHRGSERSCPEPPADQGGLRASDLP